MTHDSQTPNPSASLSYKDAGVDIDAGNRLVDNIKPIAKKTLRPGVMGGLGGFGSLFELPAHYRQPVLVAGTDGVGTKLKLAMQMGKHDSIGIDLVAMCVNDLIVQGAEPLFFLDYYATGALDVETATAVISGIGQGCEQAGAALVGGETAEMPGMYQGDDYDLAGFCVGVVEKDQIIDGSKVTAGDQLIGLASSGPHSNGYSLIRKILQRSEADLAIPCGDLTLGEALLAPTRIYVKPLLSLMQQLEIHALAHITGGGLTENIPRVLPQTCKAVLRKDSWQMPAVFHWLQKEGNIHADEMVRTFNCGVGMVICVSAADLEQALTHLRQHGETAFHLGEISTVTPGAAQVELL